MAVRITGDVPDSGLVFRRLGPNRQVVCAAPSYIVRRGLPRTLRDLAAHECIAHTQRVTPRIWHLVGADGGQASVQINGRLAINSALGVRRAALDGSGIIELNSYLVARISRPAVWSVCCRSTGHGSSPSTPSTRSAAICRRRCACSWMPCWSTWRPSPPGTGSSTCREACRPQETPRPTRAGSGERGPNAPRAERACAAADRARATKHHFRRKHERQALATEHCWKRSPCEPTGRRRDDRRPGARLPYSSTPKTFHSLAGHSTRRPPSASSSDARS